MDDLKISVKLDKLAGLEIVLILLACMKKGALIDQQENIWQKLLIAYTNFIFSQELLHNKSLYWFMKINI